MRDANQVVLVGLTRHPKAVELTRRLRERGLQIVETLTSGELPAILRRVTRTVVVVYSHVRGGEAQETLEAVRRLVRHAPVIVLVDEADFGDYYELMSDGALAYYALSERPEVIERGIAWAIRTHAG